MLVHIFIQTYEMNEIENYIIFLFLYIKIIIQLIQLEYKCIELYISFIFY